jgi:serine/threonine protein kinase
MAFENGQTEIDPEAVAASVSPQVNLSPAERLGTLPLPATSSYSDSVAFGTDYFIGSLLVGRYFIEKKLGQGGMGAVYLGRDRRLMDKPVVIKILRGEFAANDWVITKFLQEKEALSRAHHPGIVGILDAGELADGEPFIVMEFIDGITLEEAIVPQGLPLQRIAHLIKQIGSALAAAHDKGIFHRDLKPANIMLQPLTGAGEQVRIIDFGIAKVHDSLVSNQTIAGRFGTYLYMSPEQFRVEQVTAASDIYAMGAIAYEMITGRPPFDPKEFVNLGDMYSAGVKVLPRTLRPDLPDPAQKLTLKALALRPQDRFQSASEFGEALAEALVRTQRRSIPPVWQGLGQRLGSKVRLSQFSVPVAIVAGVMIAVVLAAGLAAQAFWPSPFGRENKRPENKRPPERHDPIPASTVTPVDAQTDNSLTYWLTIQKAKDQSNTFESSGAEPFESGDAFQLNVLADKPGYLYVLNEGKTAAGEMSFTMIYPTPIAGKGLAQLEGGRTIQTGRNRFSGRPGREQFWIVWSDAPIAQLEDARDKAFKNEGRLTDKALANGVREYFASHYDSLAPLHEETINHRTVARGKTNHLVKLLELEHR